MSPVSDPHIQLRQFSMERGGPITLYNVELNFGSETWTVVKRYSDFLRCHVQLLELFGRAELPELPPKEPLLQKVFGRVQARSEWAQERKARLHSYLDQLLSHPGAVRERALLRFLEAPVAAGGTGSEADDVVISGIRIRLTEEVGVVEIVVRLEVGTAPCSLRLGLRPLIGEDGEEWHEPSSFCGSFPDATAWARWFELDVPGTSSASKTREVTHQLDLEPGSLWQVGALGVSENGAAGKAAYIRLRAPTAAELASTRQAKAAAELHRKEVEATPPEQGESCQTKDLQSDGVCEPPPPGVQEDRVELHAAPAAAATGDSREEGDNSSADDEDGKEDREDDVEAHDEIGGGDGACDQEGTDGTADGGQESAGKPRGRRGWKRPESKEEHKVISFQGSVAAQYARRVEESQRLAMERAPCRFAVAEDGKPRSVAIKFSVVPTGAAAGHPMQAPDGDQGSTPTRASAEVLDKSRQLQQELQFREDERAAAQWIHAVTGDRGAKAATAGACTLGAALQSGEALCDLVNAIWPGRIVGIQRGEVLGGRRLANITRFVEACLAVGVDEQSVFSPPDLAEGKNLRSVVRCIFALGTLVPEPPAFEGPRLLGLPAELAAGAPRKLSGQSGAIASTKGFAGEDHHDAPLPVNTADDGPE